MPDRYNLSAFTPAQILETAAPMPDFSYAKDSDVETEIALIWSVIRLLKPQKVVELGTRLGISTRAISEALDANPTPAHGLSFLTVDPDVSSYLSGAEVPGSACRRAQFLQETGEALYERTAMYVGSVPEHPTVDVDVLMIDTDPHTAEQTKMWLDTWVRHRLKVGGVAMFHDIVGARPEIQVVDAVRDWVTRATEGVKEPAYVWHEYVAEATPTYGPYGLGLLWRLK